MSRHRLVRNLDLDEEMAEDVEDEEEQGPGMTSEQAQQMTISLDLARQLLSDLSPTIKDELIKESLWYYYFDVDKTVSYLRKQREKGVLQPGKPTGPCQTSSSSNQAPLSTISPQPAPPTPGHAVNVPPELVPPMTSMQKLLASRRAKVAQESKAGSGSAPIAKLPLPAEAAPSIQETASPTTEGLVPIAPTKPMSKLALLAAQRKAAAAAASLGASGGAGVGSIGNTSTASAPQSQSEKAPSVPVPPTITTRAEGSKPISKLSARIAASRKAAGSADSSLMLPTSEAIQTAGGSGDGMDIDQGSPSVEDGTITSPLLTFTTALAFGLPAEPTPPTSSPDTVAPSPSPFFSLLTQRPTIVWDRANGSSITDTGHDDKTRVSNRVSNPFDEPSPDDVILAARNKTRLGGAGEGGGADSPAKRMKSKAG